LDGIDSVGLSGASADIVIIQEAKDALRALSFTESEIDRVWPTVKAKMAENESADSIIKRALQQLYKG
jgi:Holliday junction DNA helicase RuvA